MIALVTSNSLLSGAHAYFPVLRVNAVSVSDPGGVLTVSVAGEEIVKSASEVGEPLPGS